MKHLWHRLLGLAVLGTSLAAAPGCNLHSNEVVLEETVCVSLDEYQTTGTFQSFVVCDQFKTKLTEALAENNLQLSDVRSITMKKGTFQTSNVVPHDWTVTADINIGRQDVDGGAFQEGPVSFVSFQNQSLSALTGPPKPAALHQSGVKLVNHALDSLLDGQDPRLVLIVDNESVQPTPSGADPLQFTLNACVAFQIIVKKP